MSDDLLKTLNAAHGALAEYGIDHALIGGLALGVHGVHRATVDVDFLVDGSRRMAIISALATAGFAVETETPEVLHLGGPGPLDLLLANRSPTRAMLASAPVEAPLGIKCVQVEDLIGLKTRPSATTRTGPCKTRQTSFMDFERYLQFLAQYWSLFDWPEAVRRRRRPGSFHDIRL